MAKQLMPRAELEPRDGDLHLSDEQFARLSLFAQLKRKPTLDKFPGTMILRHYRKGEVICRQGEAVHACPNARVSLCEPSRSLQISSNHFAATSMVDQPRPTQPPAPGQPSRSERTHC